MTNNKIKTAREDFKAVTLAALENPISAAGLRSQWFLDHAEALLDAAERPIPSDWQPPNR